MQPHPNDPDTPDDYEYVDPEETRNQEIDRVWAEAHK